jgi:hypothetical protein
MDAAAWIVVIKFSFFLILEFVAAYLYGKYIKFPYNDDH